LNKVIIFVVFCAHKVLSHCTNSHLDYFKDVFNTFSGPVSLNPIEAYGGVRQFSDLIKKNIYNIFLNESLRGLEQRDGE